MELNIASVMTVPGRNILPGRNYPNDNALEVLFGLQQEQA